VNKLPPVGLTPFSVGDGGTALDDGDVVVVVVVVEGACPPLFPHALAKAPIAISAEPLATTIRRRLIRPVNTIHVLFVSIVAVHAGRLGGCRRCLDVRCEQVAAGGVDALLRWRRRHCTR
jgi:hypothetical protein